MAFSDTTLQIRPFRVNQSAITLIGDGQCRAEPWNRTTPYELEARHALFTLVPLIKTRRRFSTAGLSFSIYRGARVGSRYVPY